MANPKPVYTSWGRNKTEKKIKARSRRYFDRAVVKKGAEDLAPSRRGFNH